MDSLEDRRRREQEKYARCYDQEQYAMGANRKGHATAALQECYARGSYLDVSCGRGEMLDVAVDLGFRSVWGTEVVTSLVDGIKVIWAECHELPFATNEFDVVSMFDVIEHLLPGDDELACRELQRVAGHTVLITANNRPSQNWIGEELHINIRPYDEWNTLFQQWFDAGEVRWLQQPNSTSQCWRVDF